MVNQVSRQYLDHNGIPYLANVGSKILSLLNGVKHTVSSFAELHRLDLNVLEAVTKGELGPTLEVREAIEKHCPLRVRDLYPKEYRDQFPVPDDTLGGVRVCTAEETKKTERKMFRGPEGKKILFYTYADTAMSTTSLFRPEWIAEHFVHDGIDPASTPDWAFNHGHFEHQITYFIGPVNFHWISKGKKHVRRMNTGDVNYITPFVPHTFTTREGGKGLILAVTYGGAVASEAYQSKIQELDLEDYLNSLKVGDLRLSDVPGLLSTDHLGGVLIRYYHKNGSSRNYISGSYVKNLISDIPFQPSTSALEREINCQYVDPVLFGPESWGYNIGETPVILFWSGRQTANRKEINPGDSFFIRSGVLYSFNGNGKVLVIERSEGGNPLEELALINRYSGRRGFERVHSEDTQWF